MNRVGSALSKSVFIPRLFCHRFFASGPTDARQNVLVVIVDFNGEQQLLVNGKYSELLGRSPDFPFPGNVKPLAEMQQQQQQQKFPFPLDALPTKQLGNGLGAVMPLHKIVEPSFVVSDDRTAIPRALRHHRMWQMGEDDGRMTANTTAAKYEWTVTGVDGIRMLCEEVNAMFGKRFLAGSEITVISLRANVTEAKQMTTTATSEEEEEDKTGTENTDNARTAPTMARADLIVPSYEFVRVANALCSALRAAKYWADFVDPRNGRPYRKRKNRRPAEPSLGQQSLVLEWDPQNTFNGLHITNGGGGTTAGDDDASTAAATAEHAENDDGPTCKIIERADWTAMDFCGQLFTDCPPNSEEMQQILSSFELANKLNGRAAKRDEENGGNDGGGGGAGNLLE
ncbi:hypothetical protein niasHT_019918 [Heterodera trifolii]|uniref:Uncharacterized protein n=1 Tax=Heterodera trifolii TaxID=157864 RepID=A0ABD2L8M8_9BILA